MENGISYFEALSILYAKTSTGNKKSICLKDSPINYSNNTLESPYEDTPKMMLLAL
jgi:hypothetical protein